jgi:hypothetical protein
MQTRTQKLGLPKSVEQYVGQEWGTWAPGCRIPVNTPLSQCQRDYKKQNVYKYIAKVGGLDKNLFGYATAVRRKSDGVLALINGQHRINLVKIVSPGTDEVPAHIIDVNDADFETYGSKLFHEFNGTVSKGLSNEEQFFAQVLSQDDTALRTLRVLVLAGVSCGKVNAVPNSYPVDYATFVKCIKLSETITIRAVKLLTAGLKSSNTDVLHGMVFLLSHPHYKDLADGNQAVGKHFEEWITKAVPMFHSISDLKFPRYRQGAWQKGVAFGIAQSFAKYQRNKGLFSPSIGKIKEIYESGFRKEDSGIL